MGERYISNGNYFDVGTEAFLLTQTGWQRKVDGNWYYLLTFEGIKNGRRTRYDCVAMIDFIVLGHHSE